MSFLRKFFRAMFGLNKPQFKPKGKSESYELEFFGFDEAITRQNKKGKK